MLSFILYRFQLKFLQGKLSHFLISFFLGIYLFIAC